MTIYDDIMQQAYRMVHRARMEEREDLMPVRLVMSPGAFADLQAAIPIEERFSGNDGRRLRDAEVEVDPRATRPWRLLTPRQAKERADLMRSERAPDGAPH